MFSWTLDGSAQNAKKLYVPRVEDKNSHMRMLNISSMDDLIANSMDILEPAPVDQHGNAREDGMCDIFYSPKNKPWLPCATDFVCFSFSDWMYEKRNNFKPFLLSERRVGFEFYCLWLFALETCTCSLVGREVELLKFWSPTIASSNLEISLQLFFVI